MPAAVSRCSASSATIGQASQGLVKCSWTGAAYGYGLLGHGPRTSANRCVASGASLAPDLVEVAQSEQLRGRIDEYFKALPPDERQHSAGAVRSTYALPLGKEHDDVYEAELRNDVGRFFSLLCDYIQKAADRGDGVLMWISRAYHREETTTKARLVLPTSRLRHPRPKPAKLTVFCNPDNLPARAEKFIASNVGLAPVPSFLNQEAPEADLSCRLWRFDHGDALDPPEWGSAPTWALHWNRASPHHSIFAEQLQ
jgi:hypothetical protein